MDRLQFVEFMAFNELVGTPDTPVTEALDAWNKDDSSTESILYNAYVMLPKSRWDKVGKSIMWGLRKLDMLPEWEK